MKAMIFAAGMGTRLKPLTDHKPKALIEVSGKPLLEWVIQRLIRFGFTEIVVNIHHFGEQIIEFLRENRNFGIDIHISDERELLLDTGGGLKNAAHFFDDGKPFLVHNVDILTNINLMDLWHYHLKSNALATLAVSKRNSYRGFLFDDQQQLCGWRNTKTGEVKHTGGVLDTLNLLAFSGIHVVDPAIFRQLNETGVFSIVEVYLRLSAQNCIKGYDHTGIECIDLGKIENIRQAENSGFLTSK